MNALLNNDVKLNSPARRFGFKPSSGIPDEGLKLDNLVLHHLFSNVFI